MNSKPLGLPSGCVCAGVRSPATTNQARVSRASNAISFVRAPLEHTQPKSRPLKSLSLTELIGRIEQALRTAVQTEMQRANNAFDPEHVLQLFALQADVLSALARYRRSRAASLAREHPDKGQMANG